MKGTVPEESNKNTMQRLMDIVLCGSGVSITKYKHKCEST